ncbi:MAG: hypothetical protein WBC59_04010, partial [Phycisphaerae bacterium]
GSVTYLRSIRPKLRKGQRLIVSVPRYAGAGVRVLVDGQPAGVGDLRLRESARQKRLAMLIEHPPNPRDAAQVYAVSHNHGLLSIRAFLVTTRDFTGRH